MYHLRTVIDPRMRLEFISSKEKEKKRKQKKRETKKKKKKKLNHHHLHATIVEKDNYPHDENKKRPTIVRFPEIENSKNEPSFDPPSNICQSFGTSSSEQCHLINICLLFPPPPSSKRDRSASLDPISPPRIRYIPYWSFDVPFDMPDRRQKPAGMRHRGGRSRMKGGGTSPFRNWSQDNSGATVLNIDSIVRAAAASSRSIRIRRFALRSRYVAPFSELVRSLYLFGNACKYVVFRNWKRSSGLTSSARKNFPTVDLDDQVLTDSR